MRIQPVNLRITGVNVNGVNINSSKKQRQTERVSATDTFVKSPSFGKHIELLPFFEGGIKYTPENIKKFNNILKTTELSGDVLAILIEVAKRLPHKIYYDYNNPRAEKVDFTFNRDFMFHKMSIDEITADKDCERSLFYNLERIKLTEEDYPKINQLLDRFISKSENKKSTISCLVGNALSSENLPLLNFLFKNDCEYLKKYNFNDREFAQDIIHEALEQSYRSENLEIKEKFSWKNLRHLVNDYSVIAGYEHFRDKNINVDVIETMPPNGARSVCVNNLIKNLNSRYQSQTLPIGTLARLPMSTYERKILAEPESPYNCKELQEVKDLMDKRIKNIVSKDGFDTPMNMLNCLKKPNMSEEMLTQNINGKTLIEEIAKTPLDKNNQKIMQEIISELSKYPHLKENESYRKAGVLAAEQGNAELLKFFDSRHIHYANNLKEPIESYPKEVQEILTNAKIADEKIFEFADKPEALELFLKQNPKVDINTKNENCETLLMVAADKLDIKMFSFLANREDVDLNMVDKFGENVLMRILNKKHNIDEDSIKTKEIEILRNLPNRFDVNYVNYTPAYHDSLNPYSALSKLVSHSLFSKCYLKLDLISELLKFPDIDTNFNPLSDRIPLVMSAFGNRDSKANPNICEQLFVHPNTDINSLLQFYAKALKNKEINFSREDLELIDKCFSKAFFAEAKKRYDENGYLTLNEIENLVNYSAFNDIAHEKINIVGENIGHILAETRVDENNPNEMKQLRNIFKRLNACKYDFNSKDDFGVTPLAKAIECENEPLEDMFRLFADED